MQAQALPLLPLLRSRLQAELLTLVLLTPGRERTLTELAMRVGGSVSSAQREAARAEQAGVVSSRRLGNTRLVTAADLPLTGPLTELLLRSLGPRQVPAEELAGLDGIDAALLFGSRAARYAGQVGRAPADVDLLVIGRPDRDALDEVAHRAEARLAREVNVTIRSPQWWRDGGDAFHAEVTPRPLVRCPRVCRRRRRATPTVRPPGQPLGPPRHAAYLVQDSQVERGVAMMAERRRLSASIRAPARDGSAGLLIFFSARDTVPP